MGAILSPYIYICRGYLLLSIFYFVVCATFDVCLKIGCCRLTADGQDFFTSYDEVYDSFDAMGLQENLLRGIYAYGRYLMVLFLFLIIPSERK
jgi:hypothetical protein